VQQQQQQQQQAPLPAAVSEQEQKQVQRAAQAAGALRLVLAGLKLRRGEGRDVSLADFRQLCAASANVEQDLVQGWGGQ
jgi:hypothetical protein